MAEQRNCSETSGNLFFSFKLDDTSGNLIYDQVEAAKRYWLKDESDKWVYSINDVAARLGVEPQEVPSVAAKLVHTCLHENDGICSNCEVSEPLITRDDYDNVRAFFKRTGFHVCQVCMNNDPEGFLMSSSKKIKEHPMIKKLNEFVRERNKVTSLTTLDFDYESIDAFDAMHLHALLVGNKASWSGKTFKTKLTNMSLVHPYPDTMWEVVEDLQSKGIIFPIIPDINLDLIIEVGIKDSVGIDDFTWSLATTNPHIRGITDVLSILDHVITNAVKHDHLSVKKLYTAVSLGEAMTCLTRKCIGLNADENDIACDLIYNTLVYALSFYSIGQVKRLITFVMKALHTDPKVQGFDTFNTVKIIADTIRESVDESYAEGATIEPRERLAGESSSIMTSMLFNKILKCGNVGYLSWSGKSVDEYLESKSRR